MLFTFGEFEPDPALRELRRGDATRGGRTGTPGPFGTPRVTGKSPQNPAIFRIKSY